MKRAAPFAFAILACGTFARAGLAQTPGPGPAPSTPEPAAAPAAETAKTAAAPPASGFDLTRLKLSGYLLPTFVVTQRDNAVARDRLQIGTLSSRIGLVLEGQPHDDWSYRIEIGLDAAVINNRQTAGRVVTDVGTIASPSGNNVRSTYAFTTTVPIEEASISYRPLTWYALKVGRMRMPFSVGQGAIFTTTMFPNRPAPTQVFLNGPDDGVLNTFAFLEDRIQARVGAFNGSSLGLIVPNTTPLGPVYSANVDVHPLGKMPGREGGAVGGPLRFALGVGMLYRIGTLFDATGYEATRFADTRLSAAARFTIRGLFLQGEYLRRVQTDNLSLRPAIATGVYGQGSYYRAIGRVALSPLARVGLSVQDENFAPQKTLSYEGGLAFYPRADLPEPDALRILVQYVGERRTPSEETANGAIAQLQFKW